MATRYVGQAFCDACGSAMPEPCWLVEASGRKLCAAHHLQETGAAPPRALSEQDLAPAIALPAAEPAWTRVVNGLRARRAVGHEHALELQRVRNIQGEDGPVPVGDGPSVIVPDVALVELLLMASAYHDTPTPLQMQVRLQLTRLIHGREKP